MNGEKIGRCTQATGDDFHQETCLDPGVVLTKFGNPRCMGCAKWMLNSGLSEKFSQEMVVLIEVLGS